MADQAEAWLTALPDECTRSMDAVKDAFIKRYGISESERWRQLKDLWCREQGANESVDDYVTAMQITATRVNKQNETLKEAIIKCLKP